MEIEGTVYSFDAKTLDALIAALKRHGYAVVAPVRADGAIVYQEINGAADLPVGWRDDQRAGHYSLRKRTDDAFFGFAVGPHSWKTFLFPPLLRIFTSRRNGGQPQVDAAKPPDRKYAFLGVRSCELQALLIQDRVLSDGSFVDPYYRSVRSRALTIVVNCTEPGGTCFCASMNAGPRASAGYDIALTEVVDHHEHYFVADARSNRGEEILREIECRTAAQGEIDAANRLLEQAGRSMQRSMDLTNVRELLNANFDHPRWDATAKRCLSCANCTMVCPTCFCSGVEETTDLSGQQTERWRKWDSCFTVDFSYIHGGSIRSSVRSRYRQWLMHKIANWTDQFGTPGCVGCGRCITWCPAGIDITEEVQSIRDSAPKP